MAKLGGNIQEEPPFAPLDHAPLHTAEFDFPDPLIETAVNLFMELAQM